MSELADVAPCVEDATPDEATAEVTPDEGDPTELLDVTAAIVVAGATSGAEDVGGALELAFVVVVATFDVVEVTGAALDLVVGAASGAEDAEGVALAPSELAFRMAGVASNVKDPEVEVVAVEVAAFVVDVTSDVEELVGSTVVVLESAAGVDVAVDADVEALSDEVGVSLDFGLSEDGPLLEVLVADFVFSGASVVDVAGGLGACVLFSADEDVAAGFSEVCGDAGVFAALPVSLGGAVSFLGVESGALVVAGDGFESDEPLPSPGFAEPSPLPFVPSVLSLVLPSVLPPLSSRFVCRP